MGKIRVGVLRGGPSEEYEVSMKTGASVLSSLSRDRYDPIDIVITKSGEWLVQGYTRFPEQVLPALDVVFLGLHGKYGEDGTVQRLLDRHGSRYTGSKAYPSSIAMHKALTKDYLRDSDMLLAPHLIVSSGSADNVHNIANSISDMFGPEYVIKPVSSGSSVGTSIVKNKALLPKMLKEALQKYDEVLVEKRIVGKEATCGVIENYRNRPLYVLPPIEIVPSREADFFNHTAKYDGTTKEICPGRFSKEEKRIIEDAAKSIHETLGLSQYSRSDFMIGEDGVYFLEVNTLPGLTSESLLPKAIEAVGGTYADFIEHLLTEALEGR